MINLNVPPKSQLDALSTQISGVETKVDTVDGVVDSNATALTTLDGKADAIDTVVDGNAAALAGNLNASVPRLFDPAMAKQYDRLADFDCTDFLGWTTTNLSKIRGTAGATGPRAGQPHAAATAAATFYAYREIGQLAPWDDQSVYFNPGAGFVPLYNTLNVRLHLSTDALWTNTKHLHVLLSDNSADFGSNFVQTTTGALGICTVNGVGVYAIANGSAANAVSIAGAIAADTINVIEFIYKFTSSIIIKINGTTVHSASGATNMPFPAFLGWGMGSTGAAGGCLSISNIYYWWSNT